MIEDEHGVVIEFPGNRVRGPHRIASALRFVAARMRFAVEDFPDDLHEEAKVVLARRLVHEGLLSVVSCPVPDGGSPNFVAVASTFEQADFTIVAANHYLRGELAEVNDTALGTRRPWMLVRRVASFGSGRSSNHLRPAAGNAWPSGWPPIARWKAREEMEELIHATRSEK